MLPLAAKLILDFAAATDERLELGDAEQLAELDAELMQLLKESSTASNDLASQASPAS